MADVGTPDRPLAPGNPAATRPDEPASPNHQNLLRSSRWSQMTPQSGFSLNTGRGMCNQASASLTGVVTQKIAPALQALQTKYNMISALASTIDAFMGQYTSPEEAPIAKAICKQVTEALTSTLSPSQGTTPRTTPNASNSESPHQSWAEVAKAPKNSAPLARGGAKTYPAAIAQKNAPHNNRPTDQRILITTPAEARLARPSGYAVRQAICQAVPNITLADVLKATATKTGWAITPASLEIQSRLMEEENRQLMIQAGLASAFTALDGTPINVTTELIKEEVLAQTQKEPVSCRPSRHGPGANMLTTWIISFTERVPSFQLFDSNWSKEIKKAPIIERHNPGCQGFCYPTRCTRDPRCGTCSIPIAKHTGPHGDLCEGRPRCANCHGPHWASYSNCAAAPWRTAGRVVRPTKKELNAARRAGHLAYLQESLQANASGGSVDEAAPDLLRPTTADEPTE
ncbi:hypothetical protein A1F95_11097, partial [Pyrenophora tritici-repentis]